jgi:hypothetical protein
MKVQLQGPLRMFVYGALAVLVLCGQPALGGLLTADLTCVLAGPTSVPCNSLSYYGSVTLDDSVGGGQIKLTVDIQGVADKFRDLLLNFNGAGIVTAVSSGDGQASLSPNGFSLPPYDGLFDIGNSSGCCGWNSKDALNPALYSTLLSGNAALTLGMFDVKDSLGNLNVVLHLQDLTLGGSLKAGGLWDEGGGGPGQEIPEPATGALLGGGLLMLAWAMRRRKAS